jgi:hypothetical protein
MPDREIVHRLMRGDPGNLTRRDHREFAMASGEMSEAEFLTFNKAWMAAILPCVCDGGVLSTFIDWRACRPSPLATKLGSSRLIRSSGRRPTRAGAATGNPPVLADSGETFGCWARVGRVKRHTDAQTILAACILCVDSPR